MFHYLGLILLMIVASSHTGNADTETTDLPYQQVILREDIFRFQPKTTWMNCNFQTEVSRCTWRHLETSRTLSSDDPEDPLARHTVEISNTSNSCLLRITDINFGDEGYYECNLDDDPPKYRWQLIIQGDPGPPIMMFANGTALWDDMIAIEDEDLPAAIPLRCVSSGAKPKHKKIRWLVDGTPRKDTVTHFTGPIADLWEAASEFTLTFDEDDRNTSSVKRVTCVSDHATGQKKISKEFGIRNTNDTIYLVHYELPNWDRGQLKCETHLFPAPSKYEIVRLFEHPSQEDPTHYGQQMYVKHDGRYMCRAGVQTYRSSTGHDTRYEWLESNFVEIGDEDSEYVYAEAQSILIPSFQLWKLLLVFFVGIADSMF